MIKMADLQRRRSHGGRVSPVLALLLSAMALLPARAWSQQVDEHHTGTRVYETVPDPNQEYFFGEVGPTSLGPIGPTGIVAWIAKGITVVVEETQPGTPAAGKFNKGDIIVAVNGVSLKGGNPTVTLGTLLTESEAKDGVLTFDVKQGTEGVTRQVELRIPVMGTYSKTFPLDCEKSRKVIRQAAEFYSSKDRLKKHGFLNALACLFLLSTGDDAYVPRVKEYFSQFLGKDGGVTGVGDMTWDNGYNGIACAEYYLRTGDKSVLPLLQHYCDDARDRQYWNKGWGHWGYEINPAYEGGGGLMNSAGNQVLITLLMAKECGVNVDEKTLLGALKYWYRFAGHGGIPVADSRSWFNMRTGGRDGATATAMHIAAGAQGDVSIYKQAKEYLAMTNLTSWPAEAYVWEVIWQSLAGVYMLEYDPDLYHLTQQRFRWRYDLRRQASGAFWYSGGHPSLDPTDAGISLALAYTAPLKNLRITGAPRSKFARDFKLPEHLWGNEADRAFLSSKPSRDFHQYGDKEEIHVPFWQFPVRIRMDDADVTKLPLNTMLKNVRHERYEIRLGAAHALRTNRQFGELEKLLNDPDPRVRRAGLDGITGYRPWFGAIVSESLALKTNEYTPAMLQAIARILGDPKEAWYVVDGALLALHRAPLDAVRQNIPRILPWTTHEDWWMRESAFLALMGLQQDDALFIKYLPKLIDMFVKEYDYDPRTCMGNQLREILRRKKNDSAAGKLIIAGMTRAATESKVLPDVGKNQRSQEGLYHVVQAVLESCKQAPGTSADIATAMVGLGWLETLDTPNIIRLLKAQDGEVSNRYVGFYPTLEILDPQQKSRLTEILYNDFRPVLVKRLKAGDKENASSLIDMIVDLTKLKKPIAGWRNIGQPQPENRVWRYHSFDPLVAKDKLDPRVWERFRNVTLPSGMDNWNMPGFDDGKWRSGKLPIGVGVNKARGHGVHWTATPDHSFMNHADWGDGEFLLARTTFALANADLEHDYYRIRMLSASGYEIYLNGHKIHALPWTSHYPKYEKIMLGNDGLKHLKAGENILAVFCMAVYEKDAKSEEYHAIGQMDLSIEDLEVTDLDQ